MSLEKADNHGGHGEHGEKARRFVRFVIRPSEDGVNIVEKSWFSLCPLCPPWFEPRFKK
ncbi:MAG: hypothetical protein QM739_09590 [Propionivibrio sp.]